MRARTVLSSQLFWPQEPGYLPVCDSPSLTAEISAEGLSLAGKTRGSLGRRKGCFVRRLSPIFFLIGPFFFLFPLRSAEPGLRLGLATLRYINPTQTNSLNPTKITVLMCEQKPYFCGRKGLRYHSMSKAVSEKKIYPRRNPTIRCTFLYPTVCMRFKSLVQGSGGGGGGGEPLRVWNPDTV